MEIVLHLVTGIMIAAVLINVVGALRSLWAMFVEMWQATRPPPFRWSSNASRQRPAYERDPCSSLRHQGTRAPDAGQRPSRVLRER